MNGSPRRTRSSFEFWLAIDFALSWYAYQVRRTWRKWLSRRDRGSSLNWHRFNALLKRHPLPVPRIVHRYIAVSEALP